MKVLDIEREKTYKLYFGGECIKTLTIGYYESFNKAEALMSINRSLEDENEEQIPFTRWNILKTWFKRIA